MNYQKIYESLIAKAKATNRERGSVYYESHHIKMRAHGGDNSKQNLVLLTAKEHMIAHLLLWKIYKDIPTACAVWRMSNYDKKTRLPRNFKVSSRRYELARIAMGNALKTRVMSPEARAKISKNSARKGKPNWNTGIKWKKKSSEIKLSEETKIKIGDANRGKPKPKVTCPHCNKIGGKPQMIRFHFDNCKEIRQCV